ncbi:ectoine synthase [Saccharomonospora sp. NPDC006951]
MYVTSVADTMGTAGDVHGPGWRSIRLILAKAGLGYSLHDSTIYAGTELLIQYSHHTESVFCVEGEGVVVDLGLGRSHDVSPGTMYVLDGHDRHLLRAVTDLRIICVFTPALVGAESHDENGAYPAAG